jgi:hypothetical protein
MPIRKSRVSGVVSSGTTADRPLNPSIGDTFYNGTTAALEIYTEEGWQAASSGGSSSSEYKFNVVLQSPQASATLGEPAPAGSYTISSTAGDTSFDTYLYDANGTRVGYSDSAAIIASADFVKIIVVGGTTGDLLVFSSSSTTTATESTDNEDAGAYIDSLSTSLVANVNDSITVTGGNFSSNVAVKFVGTNNVEIDAKSVTRLSVNELLVVRPDSFGSATAPYSLSVENPNVPKASGSGKAKTGSVGIFAVTGGVEAIANGYKTHTFTSNGTLVVQGTFTNAEVLMVAGGGGGGYQVGGGGGAGGVIYASGNVSMAAGNYPVTVGGGGAGGKQGVRAYDGNNSTIGSIATAYGGGGGANHTSTQNSTNGTGWPGGSGGAGTGTNNNGGTAGGASIQPTVNFGIANTGYGNAGGGGVASTWAGGGGGGAGEVGYSGTPNVGGEGGDGIEVAISGTPTYYGGGGGGCNSSSAGTNAGGLGGGGRGTGDGNPTVAKDGSSFTGGGGGGVRDTSGDGGNGGSGIIIIRYPY